MPTACPSTAVFDTINACESVEGGWDPKTAHFKRYKRILGGKQRVFVSALQLIFVGCAACSGHDPLRSRFDFAQVWYKKLSQVKTNLCPKDTHGGIQTRNVIQTKESKTNQNTVSTK